MDEVHWWSISLVDDAVRVQRSGELLNADERARAERFHFPRDRSRFVLARAGLRRVLSEYIGQSPESLRFELGSYGKPELAGQSETNPWRFNLSHSHELAVCGVTRGRRVGVDVEQIRVDAVVGADIAEQYFTPSEKSLVLSATLEYRVEAFLKLWTRKEAFLKAHGKGLSMPLNEFEVSLEDTRVRFPVGKKDGESNWSVHEVHPEEGYIAALAIEGAAEWRMVRKRLD